MKNNAAGGRVVLFLMSEFKSYRTKIPTNKACCADAWFVRKWIITADIIVKLDEHRV